MARWRRDALGLLRRRRELGEREVWLFSSGPVGEFDEADERVDRWARPKRVKQLATRIAAREHVVFGGRVSEDAGGPLRRKMAKDTPPQLRDRRDWEAIEAWAQQIAVALRQGPPVSEADRDD